MVFGVNSKNDENTFELFYSNNDIHRICKSRDVSEFIKIKQRNYAAHLIRSNDNNMTKKLLFQEGKCSKPGGGALTLTTDGYVPLEFEKWTLSDMNFG